MIATATNPKQRGTLRYYIIYSDNDTTDSGWTTPTIKHEAFTSTGIQTYIPPYEKIYPTDYPKFIPSHRVKNQFEWEIFGCIQAKHLISFKNQHRNVTFRRQM